MSSTGVLGRRLNAIGSACFRRLPVMPVQLSQSSFCSLVTFAASEQGPTVLTQSMTMKEPVLQGRMS